MKFDFDPGMIQKMAQNIAQEHVTKMTSGQPGSQAQSAAPPPAQPRMSKEDAMAMISQAETITCEGCDHHTFDSVFVIKKISALISPNGQEAHVPIQAFACSKCNHINQPFLPKEVVDDVAKKAKSKKRKAKA
mgnify:CR=1 FL=1